MGRGVCAGTVGLEWASAGGVGGGGDCEAEERRSEDQVSRRVRP